MKFKDPEKINQIAKAAIKIVYNHGLAGLTMPGIGKETKLGMGTLYVYFKTKEDLVNTLFKKIKIENNTQIHGEINLSEPWMNNLSELYLNYVQHRMDNIEKHFFLEQAVNSPYLDKEANQIEQTTYIVLHTLFNQGKENGAIKDIPNHLLQAHMLGAANALTTTLLSNEKKLSATLSSLFFGMFWNGIKTEN